MGDGSLESSDEGSGDAIRRVGAMAGLKSTSSPSSRPEINLPTRGLSELDAAGVELVLEEEPP